jgi:NAD(P)-dependent dehydrogenase (short-subunit alcohol dehydrogenase family)
MSVQTELFDISGKTAIVTGASYGIGVPMARALAAAGANVVLAARSKEKLEAVAREIEGDGVGALTMTQQCDVADSASVKAMVDAAIARFGRVDILVNNAGISAEAGMMPEHVPDDLFAQTIQTNILGTWYCCREVGAHMLADGQGGSIINIASIMGMAGQQNAPAAYQASKAAVINLTRNLACSWADRKVRVNAIAPGWFPSEMTAGWFSVPAFLERFIDQAPMGRIGDPAELCGPLLFLASGASSFVTGQTLAVDGGLSAGVGGHYTPELFDLATAILGEPGTRIMPRVK